MDLLFGIDDEDAFHRERVRLLNELEAWASGRSGLDAGESADNAALLLDWRFGYSTGELDRFTVGDVEEYLLEWCPRKLSFPTEAWPPVLRGARAWIEFLASTDRWRGGLIKPVLQRIGTIEPAFLDAMADQSNFGLAKGLFMSSAVAGAEIDVDDPESIQAAMDAFNALPDEERFAIMDPLVANMGGARAPVELAIGVDPDRVDVLAWAERAPALAQLEATIEYLGKGKALTATGNLKLVDARRLLEVWNTDDAADHTIGDHEYKLRSAADLPHLGYLLDAATDAGALRKRGNKIEPVKRWWQRDPIERVEAFFDALVGDGPLFGRIHHRFGLSEEYIEDGLAHWMVPLLYGESVEVDAIVVQATEIIEANVTDLWWGGNTEIRDSTIARQVEMCLDVVERCGLVTRDGERIEPDRYGLRDQRRGGTLAITHLGRRLLPPYIEAAGYHITSIGDLADLEASDVLASLERSVDADLAEIWNRWWPDRSDIDKAWAMVDAIAKADHPIARINGFAILNLAGAAGEGPVSELFDTPLADHAAMFLLDHGLMTDHEVAARLPRPPLGPLVDLLASTLEAGPDAMLEQWAMVTAEGRDFALNLIDTMWRVDLPETPEVLSAIGRHVTDKQIAKAAKKAAFKFRSRGL